MSVITITTPITNREKVEIDIELIECKHGKKPIIENVYTGKRKKFQGSTASCGNEECLCFGYDPKDVGERWNKYHEKF